MQPAEQQPEAERQPTNEPPLDGPILDEPARTSEPAKQGAGTPQPAPPAPSVFRRSTGQQPTRISLGLLARLAEPPELRDLTASSYRFPRRVERFLHARDRTCVFPGCTQPARRTDNDHRIPWPVGPTSADNGDCLCRHHHRAKHKVFTVRRDPDGTYIWITRGGWRFRRHPKGF